MKQMFVLVACAVVLSGCSSWRQAPVKPWQPPPGAKAFEPQLVDSNGAVIERIPFRAGVSSVTVENMAKAEGCVGGTGAGLMTPQGPVEAYRMICENGKVFTAKCELRQCKKI
jgi:hypothetical protein